MNQTDFSVARTRESALATNKVIKNTYTLLSMTLLFSALMATVSVFLELPGPVLNAYLSTPNGPELVAMAMGGTGVIFLGLSGYALTTRKDFSFMGGFLFAGMLVVLVAILANIFLQMPALSLAISAVVIMIMSGFILHDTSRMIHGGETNYLMATIGLYLNIYNIFIHLLSLLGIMGDD